MQSFLSSPSRFTKITTTLAFIFWMHTESAKQSVISTFNECAFVDVGAKKPPKELFDILEYEDTDANEWCDMFSDIKSDNELTEHLTKLRPEWTQRVDREDIYQAIADKHPEATRHKQLLEKSIFLEYGLQYYKEMFAKIDSTLEHAPSKIPSYNRYVSLCRRVTKTYQKQSLINKGSHVFLTEAFFTDLMSTLEKDGNKTPLACLLFPRGCHTGKKGPKKRSFASFDQDIPRSDTIQLHQKGSTQLLASLHLPHRQAKDSLLAQGYEIVSSEIGHLESGEKATSTRTCVHGLQPIVLSGLRLLEDTIKHRYQIEQIEGKVIRGGTESGHFFGRPDQGVVAGQWDPRYNQSLRLGSRNNLQTGAIKRSWYPYTMHGYGRTLDLGIGAPDRSWALEDFLEQGEKIGSGYRHICLGVDTASGEEICMIYMMHDDDIGYHFHISFLTSTEWYEAN